MYTIGQDEIYVVPQEERPTVSSSEEKSGWSEFGDFISDLTQNVFSYLSAKERSEAVENLVRSGYITPEQGAASLTETKPAPVSGGLTTKDLLLFGGLGLGALALMMKLMK